MDDFAGFSCSQVIRRLKTPVLNSTVKPKVVMKFGGILQDTQNNTPQLSGDIPEGALRVAPAHRLSPPQDAWAKASDLAARLRKKGTTSAVECLIASVATTHDAILIHCDSDLGRIAKQNGYEDDRQGRACF